MRKAVQSLLLVFLVTIAFSMQYSLECKAEGLQENEYSYEVLEDGSAKITGYSGSATELVIPDTINEYIISQLGEKCFMENETLESVSVPATVKIIGDSAFKKCKNLKTVILTEGLQEIGEDAFYKAGLTNFSFPSTVKKVGLRAISETQITSIHVPNTVSTWERSAFYGNRQLVTVTFDSNITEIPAGMFSACSKLNQIDIPDTVVKIGDSAFSFCGTFEKFELPEGLTSLEQHVFYSTEIKHLYAPCKNLTIHREAFSQAEIQEVTCYRYSEMYVAMGQGKSVKMNLLGPYLSVEDVEMNPGDTQQLQVYNAVGTTTWSSSDPKIVTVSDSGMITGVNKGTATITAVNDGVTMTCTVTVNLLKLSKTKATIWKGKKVTLSLEGGTNVKWKTSNKKIATVNSKGVVTGKKKGTVTITATCNGISYTCKVTVKEPKVEFKKKNTSVTVGFKTTLKLKNGKNIKWSSSNKAIATVNSKGVVTGKKLGKVTITAKCNGKKYKCKVTVKENSEKLSDIRYSNYTSGYVSIDFSKVKAVGNTYQVEGYVINKSSRRVASIKQIQITLTRNSKVLAKQWFTNVYVSAPANSQKKFTITFDKSSVKKKNVDLRTGSVQCEGERAFVSY